MICRAGIGPVPPAEKPLTPAEAVAVHEKDAPFTSEIRVTSELLLPEQIVWLKTALLTRGNGLIVMV